MGRGGERKKVLSVQGENCTVLVGNGGRGNKKANKHRKQKGELYICISKPADTHTTASVVS
jgi:hypothetical protein